MLTGIEILNGLENEYFIFSVIRTNTTIKISRWHKIHLDK